MHLPKVSEMGEWVSELEPQTYIQPAKSPSLSRAHDQAEFFSFHTFSSTQTDRLSGALARNVCFMYTLSASTPGDRSKNFFLLLQFILLFILMKMNALIAALLCLQKGFAGVFIENFSACSGAVSRWSHVQRVGWGQGKRVSTGL